MRVVYDTNIYISAFTSPGGKAEEAFELAIRKQVAAYSSPPILLELSLKLHDKFGWDETHLIDLLQYLKNVLTIISPKSTLNILKDEPDNRILECALDSGSEYIITGDHHLLSLGSLKETKIIRLAEFLEIISKEE